MSNRVVIGGQRLGAGKKMTAEMHGYGRSNHDLSYLWRTTAASGTLIPFMVELALPGDKFDIDLDAMVMTHPTAGPLFGTYKIQCDVFMTPIRLYQGQLHNDKLGIGRDMAAVKLPLLRMAAAAIDRSKDPDNQQINPSSIFAYLGIRGLGNSGPSSTAGRSRDFNGIPYLAYWDIYKNYYANKQEEIGAYIHSDTPAIVNTVTTVGGSWGSDLIPLDPARGNIKPTRSSVIKFNFTGATPLPTQLMLITNLGNILASDVFGVWGVNGGALEGSQIKQNTSDTGIIFYAWRYISSTDVIDKEPQVVTFPLKNIDDMRENLLSSVTTATAYTIGSAAIAPYGPPMGGGATYAKMYSQEGLGLKTYQSDLFNNWISTEWISGTTGVNEIAKVNTAGGSFTIDTLNLTQKIWNMLNRVAISGGSYDDYLEATYDHAQYRRATSPVYMGGLSRELIFQEVVSNAATAESTEGEQPLGTLAGKGVMGRKKKGGKIIIKVDEPSYIMGIFSLTPRIDYSQGNAWDVNLRTMADFHRPALDQIGFQDLITDQMAWWDTTAGTSAGAVPTFKSAGKQPAWINYMTNVNRVLGNFAIKDNEMFMTLNRRYEMVTTAGVTPSIKDLTTYIDPVKFNHIFAQTSRDAQNFWVQMSVDIYARRKMSAKIMPNL